MFVTTPEYSTEIYDTSDCCSLEEVTRETKKFMICELCAECNPSDLSVVTCGVVHIKVNLSPLVFPPSLRASAWPRL